MELLERRDVQVIVLMAVLSLTFALYRLSHRPKLLMLSQDTKRLLDEIRADTRSNPKGVSVYTTHPGGNLGSHVPYRWNPERTSEVDPFTRDITVIRQSVDDLLFLGFIELERTSDNWKIYRLKDRLPANLNTRFSQA